MKHRKQITGISLSAVFIALILMCSCSKPVTITEEEFNSSNQYAEYKQCSIKSVEYDPESTLKVEIRQKDDCYYAGLFEGSKFPVNLYKNGNGYYIYRKGSEEICVKKHGLVPYPESVFSNWGKDGFDELEVDISYGGNTAAGTISNETSYEGSGRKRSFLSMNCEVIEYVYYQKKNADILLNGLKVGQISIDDISKSDKEAVETRLRSKASQYDNTFTRSNLDYAHEVYKGIGDKSKADKIQSYLNTIDKFKTFYWDENEITDNKFGKIKSGAILSNYEVLLWVSENRFAFGYEETKYTGDIEVPVHDNNSSIFPGKHIHLPGNEEKEVTIIGIADINGKSFNPSGTRMGGKWISEFTGRTKIGLEGQEVYLPLFKLVQRVD